MAKDRSVPRRERLTRALVDGAKPEAAPYRLHDAACPGLFLRVQPSGAKVWNVRHAPGTSLALGKYPIVTIEKARERARRALAERDEHGSPLALRSKSSAPTLREFIKDTYAPWMQHHRRRPDEDVAALTASFEADFFDVALTDIAPSKVAGWMVRARETPSARTKRLRTAASVRRAVVRLKGLLSKAAEWRIIAASPLAELKLGRDSSGGVVRYLTPGEDSALRAALAARDARLIDRRGSGNSWREERGYEPMPELVDYADHLTPLVLFAINTGLRRGELLQVVWNDINIDARVIFVRAEIAKSGRARFVPLNADAVDVVKRWRACQPAASAERVFAVENPKKAFAAVLGAAGIKRFRFHDLRHTFASRLALADVSLYTIGELLGHADAATTQRYAHLSAGHLAAAVEVLEQKPGLQPAPPQIADQK